MGMSNHARSFRSWMLRARSTSTFDRPARKEPSVTLTVRALSGVPRARSVNFIMTPGALITLPPAISRGSAKLHFHDVAGRQGFVVIAPDIQHRGHPHIRNL